MRLDKFVWCVRLFKTRSIATKASSSDKIMLNNNFVKSSKNIVIGDEIAIKTNPIWRKFKIIDIPKSRVGAKLVSQNVIETTSEKDLEELKAYELIIRQNTSLGIKGRPTKKDRRDLDKVNN